VKKDDLLNLFYKGDATKAYELFGCHELPKKAGFRFALFAPNAKDVSIVGDFNEWDPEADKMTYYRGIWEIELKEAKAGDNYKYFVVGADDSKVMKSDPYAFHSETRPGNASKVWSIEGFEWKDAKYLKDRAKGDPIKKPTSIYELHLGSWRTKDGHENASFVTVADELAPYIKEMGYTHVELMPVSEFPFDGSWGYQVTGFFGITSRYGTPQDFMYFVEKLHDAGIGIIIDWVPAHFPRDTHGLPHFDGTYLYEHPHPLRREHPQWGTLIFNYERPEVQSFLVSSANFYFDKYHIDGIRVDAVSSMLYLDYGRQHNYLPNKDGGNINYAAEETLKKINTAVLTEHKGAITVAEESTAFPLVTKPPFDGGLGFTYKWNMGFMHDTLDYMRTDPLFRSGNHDRMTFSMYYAYSENYILAYSHDEVVHGKGSMINKMHGEYDQKFASLKTLYGFMYGHPGKKLMFMGDEFAQFNEWDFSKELDWFLLDYDTHKGIQDYVKTLNKTYAKYPALYEVDDSWDGFRWLNVDDRANSVFAFQRMSGDKQIVVICNFTPVAHADYKIALPENGKLSLILNSDDKEFGGEGSSIKKTTSTVKKAFNGMDYYASFKLAPLSVQYYVFKPEAEKPAKATATKATAEKKAATTKAPAEKKAATTTKAKATATKATAETKSADKKPATPKVETKTAAKKAVATKVTDTAIDVKAATAKPAATKKAATAKSATAKPAAAKKAAATKAPAEKKTAAPKKPATPKVEAKPATPKPAATTATTAAKATPIPTASAITTAEAVKTEAPKVEAKPVATVAPTAPATSNATATSKPATTKKPAAKKTTDKK
jgi:1,4-alpha-glucan branching enzyme